MKPVKKTSADQALPPELILESVLPKVRIIQERMQTIYRNTAKETLPRMLLEDVFTELDKGIELLTVSQSELADQYETHVAERINTDLERQRYYELFLHAPISYFVTSTEGTIREANIAATKLLVCTGNGLVGRALSTFVVEGERRAFRSELSSLAQERGSYELRFKLITAQNSSVAMRAVVNVARGSSGIPTALRWVLLPEAE
jgi:PAS domain S-box-containing protein